MRSSHRTLGLLIAVLCLSMASVGTVTAATSCVGQVGSGCFTTISSAVAAAAPGDVIQVQPGIYSEKVVITKPLSLVGSRDGGTIISAFGFSNGIVIDGSAAVNGLTGVTVCGFTVQNANFEGVLVLNASGVTISSNRVVNNNMSLRTSSAPFVCQGLTAALPFEVNESTDCGQGIHLVSVDHSTVVSNLVQNNSGGILISDETGASHDNLIASNTVSANPFGGGITMLSSAPYSGSALNAPAGVYRNTISGNTICGNGAQSASGGAGVAMLAMALQSRVSNNLVVNNQIASNAMTGLAVHTLATQEAQPAINISGNVILSNKISGNGPDVGDAATTGLTGINVYSAVATDMQIAQNVFSNQDVNVATNAPGSMLELHLNNFAGMTGVLNTSNAMVDASQNWWGCSSGPGNGGCASIVGSSMYSGWASSPF